LTYTLVIRRQLVQLISLLIVQGTVGVIAIFL